LEARVPRSNAQTRGLKRGGALGQGRKRFYAFFEALTMLLCRDMPMAAVAEGLGEHDTRLFLDFKQRCGARFLQSRQNKPRRPLRRFAIR
jgi:hypothetical protein